MNDASQAGRHTCFFPGVIFNKCIKPDLCVSSRESPFAYCWLPISDFVVKTFPNRCISTEILYANTGMNQFLTRNASSSSFLALWGYLSNYYCPCPQDACLIGNFGGGGIKLFTTVFKLRCLFFKSHLIHVWFFDILYIAYLYCDSLPFIQHSQLYPNKYNQRLDLNDLLYMLCSCFKQFVNELRGLYWNFSIVWSYYT